MDSEMKGVIARIKELISDLSDEYKSHIEEPEVTERAKNLFHESLIKMRSALDMTMHRIWKKYNSVDLTSSQGKSREPNIYFPICEDRENFDNKLKIKMKLDLEKDAPVLHALLLRAQPFSTDRNDLCQLRDLANMGKHTNFAQQTKKSRIATRMRSVDGTEMIIAPPVDVKANEHQGKKYAMETIELIDLVEYSVDGQEIMDPVIFCISLCKSLERYLANVLDHV